MIPVMPKLSPTLILSPSIPPPTPSTPPTPSLSRSLPILPSVSPSISPSVAPSIIIDGDIVPDVKLPDVKLPDVKLEVVPDVRLSISQLNPEMKLDFIIYRPYLKTEAINATNRWSKIIDKINSSLHDLKCFTIYIDDYPLIGNPVRISSEGISSIIDFDYKVNIRPWLKRFSHISSEETFDDDDTKRTGPIHVIIEEGVRFRNLASVTGPIVISKEDSEGISGTVELIFTSSSQTFLLENNVKWRSKHVSFLVNEDLRITTKGGIHLDTKIQINKGRTLYLKSTDGLLIDPKNISGEGNIVLTSDSTIKPLDMKHFGFRFLQISSSLSEAIIYDDSKFHKFYPKYDKVTLQMALDSIKTLETSFSFLATGTLTTSDAFFLGSSLSSVVKYNSHIGIDTPSRIMASKLVLTGISLSVRSEKPLPCGIIATVHVAEKDSSRGFIIEGREGGREEGGGRGRDDDFKEEGGEGCDIPEFIKTGVTTHIEDIGYYSSNTSGRCIYHIEKENQLVVVVCFTKPIISVPMTICAGISYFPIPEI